MSKTKPFVTERVTTYFLSIGFVLIAAFTVRADINNPIFSQPHNNSWDFSSLSQKWLLYNVNSEAADDFDVVGQVERITVDGWVFSSVTQYQGVTVKIFAVSAENKPGALQYEEFFPAGGPGVTRSNGYFSIILTTPFQATGRHFLHVQAQMDAPWYWKTANANAPHQARYTSRNVAAGQTLWSNNVNSDLGMTLYGTTQFPPQITSLSETSINRSGYFEINGENMGAIGEVLINGAPAPFTRWSIYNIHAYVPESAPLGNVLVQVQTSNGISNAVSLEVTPRQSSIPHIKWRFRMDSIYSRVRPALGPDGTVYAVDVYGYLYALSADGGLKWIVRGAGDKGVDVGADGIVYTASENNVKSFNPDGTLRWTFVQTPRAFIMLGLSVGPDGNIYGVASSGMGVFSLTPQGTLRWATPEQYRRPNVIYSDIVFGPNGNEQQLYFSANAHTRSVRLSDGASIFEIGTGQPVVSPYDGTVHQGARSYSPQGSLLWYYETVWFPSLPSVGTDGVHYVINVSSTLFALNPNGTEKYNVPLGPGSYDRPSISPDGSILLASTINTDATGAIGLIGLNPANGVEMWRTVLPAAFGQNTVFTTKFTFSADSRTAYINSELFGTDNANIAYLNAVDVGSGVTPTPSPTPRWTGRVTLHYIEE